jgi:PHD/YefM family antitoxin component YafN of YafNO toxin-antitoxin module
MVISVFTSRESNQGYSKIAKASDLGPVVITYHGRPRYVILKYEDYTAAKDGTYRLPTSDEIAAAIERVRKSRLSPTK